MIICLLATVPPPAPPEPRGVEPYNTYSQD